MEDSEDLVVLDNMEILGLDTGKTTHSGTGWG